MNYKKIALKQAQVDAEVMMQLKEKYGVPSEKEFAAITKKYNEMMAAMCEKLKDLDEMELYVISGNLLMNITNMVSAANVSLLMDGGETFRKSCKENMVKLRWGKV